MVKGVGFVISKEDLTWDQGTGLITQGLLCSRVLLQHEKGQRKLLIAYQKGDGECSLTSLSNGAILFLSW